MNSVKFFFAQAGLKNCFHLDNWKENKAKAFVNASDECGVATSR